MEMMEVVERLAQLEQRSKSNTHRINALEENTELLHVIAKNTEVLATKQEYIGERIAALDRGIHETGEALEERVSKIEKTPASRWNSVVDKVLTGVVAALVAAAMALLLK